MLQHEIETERSRKVVLDLMAALGVGDFERAIELFDEDAVFWVPGRIPFSGTLHGKREIYEKNFRPSAELTAPGTFGIDVSKVIAEGKDVAAEFVFRRKTLDGRDYANNFFVLFVVENGKIMSMREHLDTQYAMDMLWPQSGSGPDEN